MSDNMLKIVFGTDLKACAETRGLLYQSDWLGSNQWAGREKRPPL